MSNEYKEWLQDNAVEYLLENTSLNTVEYIASWYSGYLIIGQDNYQCRRVFFVYNDEDYSWAYREWIV